VEGNTETFVGYDQTESEAKITRIQVDSKRGVMYQIVLDSTPFYPEGGGQVGDKGVLVSANETIQIIDTKKENNLILHFTKKLPENVNGILWLKWIATKIRYYKKSLCDALDASGIEKHIGTHVEQKGSLVSPNHLRFDFLILQK
jgi:alanyl-tRNA synthetase